MYSSNSYVLAAIALGTASQASLPVYAQAVSQGDLYQEAVKLHRSGKPLDSVPILQGLHARNPENTRYLYDLIAALSAGERDTQVRELAHQVGPDAPAYVLEALGRSHRNLHDYVKARQFYERALITAPERVETLAGLAMTMADDHQPQTALDLLERLAPTQRNATRLQEARAYALWRSDRLFPALRTYQALLARNPDNQAALQGRQQMLEKLGLEALVRPLQREPSAKQSVQDPDMILRALYTALMESGSLEQVYALGQRMLQQGNGTELSILLENLPEIRQQDGRLERLLAQAYWQTGKARETLAATERFLSHEPQDQQIQRLRIQALVRLGASRLASSLAQKTPDLFSAKELLGLRLGAVEELLSWRQGASLESPVKRYALAQQALLELDQLGSPDAVQAMRVRAFRAMERAPEAIEIYEMLENKGGSLPFETRLAAADAYLIQKRPQHARLLYEALTREQSKRFEPRIGLFYAQLESEDFETARLTLAALAKIEPRFLNASLRQLRQPNEQWREALAAQAMLEAYSEHLEQALKRMNQLISEFPGDAGLRASRATILALRGWPRQAQTAYDEALLLEPGNLSARVGRAEQSLEVGRLRSAEDQIRKLQAAWPEQESVRQLARRWNLNKRPELVLVADTGQSSNPALRGQHDYRVEGWLYASPLTLQMRPYLHVIDEWAEIESGQVRFRRLGAGLEYVRPFLDMKAEVHQEIASSRDPGLALTANWRPDDYWRYALQYDSNGIDLPLLGRSTGISGPSYDVNVGWRANESHNLNVNLQYVDMSDGNQRRILAGSWQERLHASPTYILSGQLLAYGSVNTPGERPYFNPARDASLAFSFDNDWLGWRHYTRSFRQQLGLTLGDYWQKDAGHGLIGVARYDHAWDISHRLNLRYGLSFTRHPYDGAPDDRLALHLQLSSRF